MSHRTEDNFNLSISDSRDDAAFQKIRKKRVDKHVPDMDKYFGATTFQQHLVSELQTKLSKDWKNAVANKSLNIYIAQRTLYGYKWVQHISLLRDTRVYRTLEIIYISPETKEKVVGHLKEILISSKIYDWYGLAWKLHHGFNEPDEIVKKLTILALSYFFKKDIAEMMLTSNLNVGFTRSLSYSYWTSS